MLSDWLSMPMLSRDGDESGGRGPNTRTIAVVDDDPEFLEVMGDLLTSEGYKVHLHHFRTAEQSHTKISDKQADLIILDLRVGDTNAGFDLLKLLRLDMRTAKIPVLMCTADSLFLQIRGESLKRLGALPLEKPFQIEHLLSMIRDVFDAPAY